MGWSWRATVGEGSHDQGTAGLTGTQRLAPFADAIVGVLGPREQGQGRAQCPVLGPTNPAAPQGYSPLPLILLPLRLPALLHTLSDWPGHALSPSPAQVQTLSSENNLTSPGSHHTTYTPGQAHHVTSCPPDCYVPRPLPHSKWAGAATCFLALATGSVVSNAGLSLNMVPSGQMRPTDSPWNRPAVSTLFHEKWQILQGPPRPIILIARDGFPV